MKKVAAVSIVALLLASISIMIAWAPAEFKPTVPLYKVVIVAGQSNAVGRAPILPEWRVNNTGIYQLGRFGDTNLTILPAIEPLAHWDASGAAFALPAVRSMRQAEGGIFLIIPAAYGGSGFIDNMWTAGTGPLYVDLVDRVRSVLSRFPRSTIRAVFWHQGESEWEESPEGYNADFPMQLSAMIDHMRTDLPINGVPFLIGGLVPEWADQRDPHPNVVLRQVALASGACFVDSGGLLPLADGIHFELGSQHELGQRYVNALYSC